MSATQFPSGEWIGFYTYSDYPKKFLMDLILEFRSGLISGEGMDDIGAFVIAGNYQAETLECFMTKSYIGQHCVEYRGFREGKGIWGTWALTGAKGGFHIWPLSQGSLLLEKEEEECLSIPVHPR